MDILNIFYDEFLNEASLGRIDCGFIYNVMFSTSISHKQYIANSEELQIPTLIISNKDEFDILLNFIYKKLTLFMIKIIMTMNMII